MDKPDGRIVPQAKTTSTPLKLQALEVSFCDDRNFVNPAHSGAFNAVRVPHACFAVLRGPTELWSLVDPVNRFEGIERMNGNLARTRLVRISIFRFLVLLPSTFLYFTRGKFASKLWFRCKFQGRNPDPTPQ